MTNRETNEQCLLVHMKAEAEHDMAAVLATIHPDALFEDQPLGLVLNGRDATARHYRTWWDAFGIQTDGGVLHWVSDDLAIGEADFVGTHVGRFLGGRTDRSFDPLSVHRLCPLQGWPAVGRAVLL